MFMYKLALVYFFLLEVWSLQNVAERIQQEEGFGVNTGREKRDIETITIETVVILDEDYIAYLRSHGHRTNESLYELVALKWMGVQAEWGRTDVLGYDVRIAIKEIVLWETNPAWYTPSNELRITLWRLCFGAKSNALWREYDQIYLFTGKKNIDGRSGIAYTGGICVNSDKCALSAITSVEEYVITAHELGHSLGMEHDGDVGCPSPNDGIMGSKTMGWSSCSVTAMKEQLNITTTACLFRTDVKAENQLNLTEAWPGMVYTDDEICEFRNGVGYRYKTNSEEKCASYMCVNMNRTSPLYGVSFSVREPTDGSFCGEETVCSSRIKKCISWNETSLDRSLFTRVEGKWSPWSSMTSCSRTCGTGVRFRQRTCNNPKPQNSAWCEGNEVDLKLCNIESCEGDGSDESELIKQRAGETCTYWKKNNVFEAIEENSTNYLNTGKKYSNNNHGQCEVKCGKADNFTGGGNKRHGIIPDGTPCTPKQLSSFVEKNNLPRKSGVFGRCFQGYCHSFGCDNKPGSTQRDGCGVCGGTNTTCKIVEGVYEIIVEQGERGLIDRVPANASLIQFYFNYGDMKNHFLELRAPDTDKAIIKFGTFDTTKDPVKFAGTEWYLLWYKQYLYAQGPTDQDIVIKLYNNGGNNNTGIKFAYSLPLQEIVTSSTTTEVITTNTSTTVSSTKSSISSFQSTESSTVSSVRTEASTQSNVTYVSTSPRMETTEKSASKVVGIVVGSIVGTFVVVLVAILVLVIFRRRLSSQTFDFAIK